MNKAITLVAAFAMVSALAIGQDDAKDPKDQNNLSTTVIAINSYRPTISDAKKLAESPSTIDTNLVKEEATYLFSNEKYQTQFVPDSISAAKIKGEPLDPLYRAYVRAGAGNGINFLSDVYIHSLRSRNSAIGLEMHGRGAQGVFNELPPAPYNRFDGAFTAKKFLKKHAISGSVNYDRERLQYYGYDLSDNNSLAIYNELIDQNIDNDPAIRSQFK